MPKVRLTKDQKLNDSMRAAICRALVYNGKRGICTSLMPILNCKSETTARKKFNDPGELTVRELRHIMASLHIAGEDILPGLR